MVKKIVNPPAQPIVPTEAMRRPRRNVPLRPDLADCRTEEDFHAYAGLPNEGVHPSQFRTDVISADEYNEVWDTNGVIPNKTSIDRVRPEHEEALIELLSKIYPDGLKNREVRKTVSYLFAFNNCQRAKQDPANFKVNWAAVAAKSRAYSSKVKSDPETSAPTAEPSKSQHTTAHESMGERAASAGTGVKLGGGMSFRRAALCPAAHSAYGENIARLESLLQGMQGALKVQQSELVSKKELVAQSQAKGTFFLAAEGKLQNIKDNIARLQALSGPDAASASAEILTLEREKDMAEYMLKSLLEMGGGPIDETIVQKVAALTAEIAIGESLLARAQQNLQNVTRLREMTKRNDQLVSITPVPFRLPYLHEERCSTCGLAFQDDYTLSLRMKCGHHYHVSCLSLLMEKTCCLECSEPIPTGLVQEVLHGGAVQKTEDKVIDDQEHVATTPDSNRKRKQVNTPRSRRTPGSAKHKSTRVQTPLGRQGKKGTCLFSESQFELASLEDAVGIAQQVTSSLQHNAADGSTVLKTPTQAKSKGDSSSTDGATKFSIVPNSAAASTKASSNTVAAGKEIDGDDVDRQVRAVVSKVKRLTRSSTRKLEEESEGGQALIVQDSPKPSGKRQRRQVKVILSDSDEEDNTEKEVPSQPLTYKRRQRTKDAHHLMHEEEDEARKAKKMQVEAGKAKEMQVEAGKATAMQDEAGKPTGSQETPIFYGQGGTSTELDGNALHSSPPARGTDSQETQIFYGQGGNSTELESTAEVNAAQRDSRVQQSPAHVQQSPADVQQSPPDVAAKSSRMQHASTSGANVEVWEPRRKMMVLDINGVLCQTQQRRMGRKILPPPQTSHVVKQTVSKYLICRPGYHEFVEWALQRFDIVIWSASLLRNTQDMVDALFPDLKTKFKKVYGQEDCYECDHPTNTSKPLFFKELKVVLEDFSYSTEIFLVDDSLHKGFLNPVHTTLPVRPFRGQEEDNFLQRFVCPALDYLTSHTVQETISRLDLTDAWLQKETVDVLDFCLTNYLVSAYYLLNAPEEVQRQLMGMIPEDS